MANATPRETSFAPQFLVDDLERSMAFYRTLGFSFGEPWDGFYAIGRRDGLQLHLKEAPKNQAERRWRRDNEHLDASAGVEGIDAFHAQCLASGVAIRWLASMLVTFGVMGAGARFVPADSALGLILLPAIVAVMVGVAFWAGEVPRQPPPGSKPTHLTR